MNNLAYAGSALLGAALMFGPAIAWVAIKHRLSIRHTNKENA
jgi:hypothetical protein